MNFRFEYMTLTQIGACFGVSNQEVGRWLTDLGLRKRGNNGNWTPSEQAFAEGIVKAGPSRGNGYNWIWQSKKTVKVLIDGGHQLVPNNNLITPSVLNGPFTFQRNPQFGHEIVNSDGSVCVYVKGEENASFVCRILNTAHQTGIINKILCNNSANIEE